MVLLHLNRDSQMPLFRQVYSQLKEKIDHHILKPGDQLPPTRVYAHQLGVNRTTVYKAYQELWALGYIDSRSGSYSTVRRRRESVPSRKKEKQTGISWAEQVNPQAEEVYAMFGSIQYPFSEKSAPFTGIDFGRLHPDTRLFPVHEFRKSLNKVVVESPETTLDYGPCNGHLQLREYIAGRQRLHGISVSADEIMITSGAQNGLDLLMKLLAKPGSRVLVESPTYGMILPALTYYQCRVVPVPMTPEGADLAVLEKELKNEKPAFFYTMPNFHNPTGITTSQEHREKLIALFESAGVPVIEDAFEEEMKYFGKVPLPIKSMDHNQVVIYVGSFSKVLFPGIRVGWITADRECIKRLAVLKRFGDISSSLPEQAALADFCRQGFYELHIKRIHKIFRKRMMLAVNTLEQVISNPNVSWIEPNGGFTIWLTLKESPLDYEEINKIFAAHQIRLAVGRDFFPFPQEDHHFRLAIASLNETEIIKGINRLSLALEDIYR